MNLNESIFEGAAFAWTGDLGYAVGHGSKQTRTLAALRGALLPRMLSGELSVAELQH